MSPPAPVRTAARKRESGVVLALVLILGLLLSASIITFERRAVIDTMIVRNRDDAAKAEALARGGLRLASALLVEDRLAKNLMQIADGTSRPATAGNTPDDLWNQVGLYELSDPDGGRLRIQIEDAGGKLNLNAVAPYTGTDAPPDQDAEEFLVTLFELVISGMDVPPEESTYEPRELARNFLDYVDVDEIRSTGGAEDDYYLSLDPPHRAANRPLLSIEELGLIEGFDVQFVDAIRPYVTVYPVVGGTGINLNTAPPHVLGLVYYGVGGSRRLVSQDTVARILRQREDGFLVCTKGGGKLNNCVTLSDVGIDEGSIFPPAELPDDSDIFSVTVHAEVRSIERTLMAVVDRSELTEPQVLFWRMQ